MALLDRFSRTTPPLLLHGEKVHLRLPQAGDWAEWVQLRAESRDFLTPWEPTWPSDALTRAAFRRRLRRHTREAREDAAYAFLIFRHTDDVLLGGLTLSNVRRGVTQSCSVGYWIGRRFARRGYMSDALCTAVHFVFDHLHLHRLDAACLPNNDASTGVLRRVGFTEEGYARQYLCIDGIWRDHLLFAILAGDTRHR
jgi:ribosomal-protein-alanine N-acetyltransferase